MCSISHVYAPPSRKRNRGPACLVAPLRNSGLFQDKKSIYIYLRCIPVINTSYPAHEGAVEEYAVSCHRGDILSRLRIRVAKVFDLGFELCKDLNSRHTPAEDRQ